MEGSRPVTVRSLPVVPGKLCSLMTSEPNLPLATDNVYGRTFWLAYVANTTLITANALTFRFANLVVKLGGDEKTAGLIVALALTIAVILRFIASHWVDLHGTVRVWPIMSCLYVIGCITSLIPVEIGPAIYASRIAYIVGIQGMFVCSMTHIQQHVPSHRRTEIIGNLGSSGFVGMILGANLGDFVHKNTAPEQEFFWSFGLAACLGFLYLAIIVTLTRTSGQSAARPQHSDSSLRLLFRHWPGSVVLTAMVMGVGIVVTQVFLARFANEQKIQNLGIFYSGYAVSAFLFRLSISNWSNTIGRNWMLVRGLAGHVIGHALLPFVQTDWQLFPVAVICGFGHSILFPAVVSLGSGAFPPESRGSGTAVILSFADLGGLILSPILGWLIVARGYHAMFWSSSGMGLVVLLIAVVVAIRHHDPDRAVPPVSSPMADTL